MAIYPALNLVDLYCSKLSFQLADVGKLYIEVVRKG